MRVVCICGEINYKHKCNLSHKEKMFKYFKYLYNETNFSMKSISRSCSDGNNNIICPYEHDANGRGCASCGTQITDFYYNCESNSKKYEQIRASVCNKCYQSNNCKNLYYCFDNMELTDICHRTKALRVLLIREVFKRHKVPLDIRKLISKLLSCNC